MSTKLIKKHKFIIDIEEIHEFILTNDALSFLIQLHEKFNPIRLKLLEARKKKQSSLNSGQTFSFLNETQQIREDLSWKIPPLPEILKKRWVELTGPTDKKMLINALNSGADVYMADFEDSNAPTWKNMIEGQINLFDAIRKKISFQNEEGKIYKLNDSNSVLFVRPRGLHLNEKHFLIGNEEISASFFDFGLYFFHNASELIERKLGPYFYLPKLESHLEAKLWNDIFIFAQKMLNIPHGTIKATVLIETIPAAFEMDEILYELKDHSAGLNAGRWDYIFSIIKKFQMSQLCLPDRAQITMNVPFMKAYSNLIVKTCHKRNVSAIGGMSAFIPNRKDPEVTEKALKKVIEDKQREVDQGFDGTWVAHPDLIPIAREVFYKRLKEKANQIDFEPSLDVQSKDLLNFNMEAEGVTDEGIKENIYICLKYLTSWFNGIGAVSIHNLMEDLATAEISRAQLWEWLHHKAKLKNGIVIDSKLIQKKIADVIAIFQEEAQDKNFIKAKNLLEKLIFAESFTEFLSIEAYKEL